MKTVYIVTDGDYSDYHIVAAFDDKKLAELFIEKIGAGDIEEYQLNIPGFDIKNKNLWLFRMIKKGDT